MLTRYAVPAALPLLLLAGCATTAPEVGPPLDDADGVAEDARATSGPERPWRIRFAWNYGDPKGTLRGDGVARVNPPGDFRLDFFTAGEGSMAAVLVGAELRTLGQIEDVRLPEPPFLYAMAGLFRPGPGSPDRGYDTEEGQVLVYELEEGTARRFVLREGRLVRAEEREGGRVVREISLQWPTAAEEAGPWPSRAEYRDRTVPSRVRWTLEDVRAAREPFPPDIYALDASPR